MFRDSTGCGWGRQKIVDNFFRASYHKDSTILGLPHDIGFWKCWDLGLGTVPGPLNHGFLNKVEVSSLSCGCGVG